MTKWLLAIFALLSFGSIASGEVSAPRVTYYAAGAEASGGEVEPFLKRIASFRKWRVRVALSGKCISSCTLYANLLEDGLLCAAPGTTLVFHQFMRRVPILFGADGQVEVYRLDPPTADDVRMTWGSFPRAVQRAVLRRSPTGLPDRGQEISVPAREVGIPSC